MSFKPHLVEFKYAPNKNEFASQLRAFLRLIDETRGLVAKKDIASLMFNYLCNNREWICTLDKFNNVLKTKLIFFKTSYKWGAANIYLKRLFPHGHSV